MHAPTTSHLLADWHWEPTVLIGLAALIVAYWYVLGPLRERRGWGASPTRAQMAYFATATVLLALALLSPLDELGDSYLFSAHMVQHLVLATLWPPLMLLSLPAWTARALMRTPIAPVVAFFTYPAVALLSFNVDIYLWHIPALYDATLANEYIHIAEHLTFMGFGLVTWWPVLSPAPEQRLSYPLQLLYLLANGMFMMGLGIVFTFAPTVFYPPYAAAPRIWGTTPAGDQQIGGLIMWYPGNMPYAWAIVVAFYKWFETGGQSSDEPYPRQERPSPTIGPSGP